MKHLITIIAVFATGVLVADEAPKSVAKIVARETGGSIKTLYKTTKKIYYVNAQQKVQASLIDEARAKMELALQTPIDSTNGLFEFPTPKISGELSLYIIDDDKMPMSLISPEGRWAFVNVAPLSKGRGEGKAFFEARFKKEMARVACMLFGGIGSAYKENLLSFIGSAEDLDKFESDVLPIDGPMRCSRYLLGMGVKPWRKTTYKKACEEGWAPAPTNEIQKTVWDKVHAIPNEPLKIEYDPATQKGKVTK